MKITRSYLKQVIKEELERTLSEGQQTVSVTRPIRTHNNTKTIQPGMYYVKPTDWSNDVVGLYTYNDNYTQHVGDVFKKDLA
jgi:hypothetical protein